MEPSSDGTNSGCTNKVPTPRETQNQAIRRSRGGLVTKIAAPGNHVQLVLLPGQGHDSAGVAPLLTERAVPAIHPERPSALAH
jgi:hypothetical protein